MHFTVVLSRIFDLVMLILSLYLLLSGGRLTLNLLSNPNLDVATELIRLFWGITGTVYFTIVLFR